MVSKNYWMIPRPQRQLYRLPLTVSALHEAAAEAQWTGNRDSHIAFEEILEREGIKRRGARRDGSGSGGRTHAVLVRCLGLAFNSNETQKLEMTMAGLALAEEGQPQKILKHQVMRFQYPSAYSVGRSVDISSKFKLRPFVLLLRLLLHPALDGWISQDEVALIVIVHGTGDSPADADRIAQEIVDYRQKGIDEGDFLAKYGRSDDTFAAVRRRFSDIANTVFNWLETTEVIDRDRKFITMPEGAQQEAQHLLEVYGTYTLIRYPDDEDRFQRTYGLPPGKKKDTRNLLATKGITRSEFVGRTVNTILTRWSQTELLVDGATPSLIQRLVAETSYDYSEVELAAKRILGTDRTLDAFMYHYQSLLYSTAKDAPRKFEQATATIFQKIFGLEATCVGQAGREPDVVVRKPNEWRGIVGTKAYGKEYSLPSAHERAMREYVENYRDSDHESLAFWVFIAGAISRGARFRAKALSDQVGVPGSVVGMLTWQEIVRRASKGQLDADRLAELFSSTSELTLADI
ncbi:restriction endonuclease FokI C-terminal domain-containing protein [Brevibacterium casei]|uniref:restriction endonuclease FokI C-terminal domain-containing protein n=1 Tax=Brevibacterium casei TaxID=33889 RepID=UPI003F7F67AE